MPKRKVTLAIFLIIILAIIFLNQADNPLESREFVSQQSRKASKEKDSPLLEIPISTKAQETRLGIKKNEDFGIFSCLPDIVFDDKGNRENIKQYFQSLENSLSEADPLYYALYAEPAEGETRLDLLLDYYNQFPNSPVVAMNLISLCANSPDERCTKELVSDAIATDRNNGAIWVSGISFYAALGDDAGVMDAIEALEKTSSFNERFGERVLLYAQALEGSTSNHFNLNAIVGIGKAASSLLIHSPITQWCKQGLDKPDIANACLTLGEQLETRGKTQISKTMGIAIQDMVFESQDNIDAIQVAKQRRSELTGIPDWELYRKASLMLLLDERLLRGWLNNLDTVGEVESQRLLVEEAQMLYEENENYLCTLIYELVSSF